MLWYCSMALSNTEIHGTGHGLYMLWHKTSGSSNDPNFQMDLYVNILTLLAILEFVFCYDIVKFKRGSVDSLKFFESLDHVKSRLSCATACQGHVMCHGFHYCTEPYCTATTCMLFTKNLAIGKSSALVANPQVSAYTGSYTISYSNQ